MPLLAICNIVLLLGLSAPTFAQNTYIVDLAPRGIVFGNPRKTRIFEPRLCLDQHCLFVEKMELDLLGIDLGDNSDEIFATLQKMNNTDKRFLFQKLLFVHLKDQ